jgi:anti-anti-sigma regulatory factor
MHNGNGAADAPLVLDATADDLPARFDQALASGPERELIIDLRTVTVADPALLRTLSAIADAARAAERQVCLIGARPEVYKALHVAGLAAAFRRL